jgi:aryl-alcohol dehydrogenase-like predicted oxidoreductase
MNTRRLGTNGPELTEIGFGAWAIGGPWLYGWGAVDDEQSVQAIHRSLDLGINWIDTAAAYGLGHSEEVVALALRGMSPRPFIATKCALVPDGREGMSVNLTPASIRSECEASLRRLAIECIDVYQIHWPGSGEGIEEAWETMAALKREGKARFIGVSNFGVDLLERCQRIAPVQSLQPPYSLIARDFEHTTKEYCLRHGIGVIAYSPMQSGLLTGRFDPDRLAPDDWRRKVSLFREPDLSRALAFVDKLRPLAARRGRTVGQLAIAWVLREAPVTAAIVGARTPTQTEENASAAGWTLLPDEREAIEDIYRREYANHG